MLHRWLPLTCSSVPLSLLVVPAARTGSGHDDWQVTTPGAGGAGAAAHEATPSGGEDALAGGAGGFSAVRAGVDFRADGTNTCGAK